MSTYYGDLHYKNKEFIVEELKSRNTENSIYFIKNIYNIKY